MFDFCKNYVMLSYVERKKKGCDIIEFSCKRYK